MHTPTLPAKTAHLWNVLPLFSTENGAVQVATVDLRDNELLTNISVWLGAPVEPVLVNDKELHRQLERHYGVGAAALDDHDIPQFVELLINKAIRDRATDIHIEPFGESLDIRFRIDGLLHPVSVPPLLRSFEAQLFSRIKVMAEIDVSERRRPQDGRIRWAQSDTPMDIRVSTVPTIHGESLDLRLLPHDRLILGLEELGMSAETLNQVERIISKPNGIFLVTGPTGHGKTTTLYAGLSRINSFDKKIIAIEDPVEYQLRGVNQIQVHSSIGLTFSTALRSILRQDPDIVMIGEIRDKDTADIAVRASLTGHLVFSTLHTTDTTSAIARLIDMGVEPYLLASSLQAVLAQRLVRRVCESCSGQGTSCDDCLETGYRGRTGLFELLVIDEKMRELIQENQPSSFLRKHALASGMKRLFDEGQEKVRSGLTTTQEILRVAEDV